MKRLAQVSESLQSNNLPVFYGRVVNTQTLDATHDLGHIVLES